MNNDMIVSVGEDLDDEVCLGSGNGLSWLPYLNSRDRAKVDVISRLTGIPDPYRVFPELTWPVVLGILLVYFRYFTSEMLTNLFPTCSGLELGLLKRRFKKYVRTARYKGHKMVYYLSPPGFDYFRSKLPGDIIKKAMIPYNAGRVNEEAILCHDTDLRMVLCACLKSFYPSGIGWYTSVKLFLGKSPEECIKEAMGNPGRRQPDSSGELIRADAVMVIDGNCMMIEQDAGTEHKPVIREKLEKYVKYMISLDNRSYQIIFNICVNFSTPERLESKKTVCKNIRDLMKKETLATLGEASNLLSSLLQANPKSIKLRNMYRLIDEYYGRGGSPSSDITALGNYVDSKTPVNPKDRNRANEIREIVYNLYANNGNMRHAIKGGLSLPITYDIRRQAYYIDAYDSGFLDKLIKMLEKRYPGYSSFEKKRVTNNTEGMRYRNFIRIADRNSVKAYCLVSEISTDVGERIRMTEFIKNSSGSDVPITLILIVDSVKDAAKFAEETGFAEKYCNSDDITVPNPEYRITIRFVTYEGDGLGPDIFFITDRSGVIRVTDNF